MLGRWATVWEGCSGRVRFGDGEEVDDELPCVSVLPAAHDGQLVNMTTVVPLVVGGASPHRGGSFPTLPVRTLFGMACTKSFKSPRELTKD
jgi:hypothetical protein